MSNEKYEPTLQNAVDKLRAMSDEDRQHLMNMIGKIDRDATSEYPSYIPECVSHDDIEMIYDYLVSEALALVRARDYAATGTLWSMCETISLIIADANSLTAQASDLNRLLNERDEQLFEAHQRPSDD